eukprot:2617911-Rhodomonas_salina.1
MRSSILARHRGHAQQYPRQTCRCIFTRAISSQPHQHHRDPQRHLDARSHHRHTQPQRRRSWAQRRHKWKHGHKIRQ